MAVALLCAAGAWAQGTWTAPAVPGVNPLSTSGDMYLYNIGADAFVNYGMNWNTQAIATRLLSGDETASSRHLMTVTVDGSNIKMSLKDKSDKTIFCGAGTTNDIWTDNTYNNVWTPAASANYTNAYTLTSVTHSKMLDVQWLYGGRLTFDGGQGFTDWAFIPATSVTDGSYAKYKERKAMYAIYKELADNDKVSTYATALATANAVYVSSSATKAELRAATRALLIAVADGIENPVNANSLFTNADILGNNTITDWGTSFTVTNGVFERYHIAYTLSQTKTDIPNGLYDVTFHGLYRQDGSAETAPHLTVTGTNVMEDDLNTIGALQSMWSVSNGNSNGGLWTAEGLPNHQIPANQAMTLGDAVANINNVQVKDSCLTIQLAITGTDKWVLFQGFDIVYNGPINVAVYKKMMAQKAIADTYAGQKMNASVESALNSAITTAAGLTANSDEDDLNDAYNALVAVNESAPASIAVYTQIAAVNAKAAVLDASGVAAYASTLDAYNNGTLTSVTEAQTAYVAAVKSQTTINSDWTGAISNPDFSTSDLTAWNFHSKSEPTVDTSAKDCEFFNKEFDMSQTLTGMKKGTYEITFHAFQRPGAANTDLATAYNAGTWTSVGTLYTTAEETSVTHIWSEAGTSQIYNKGGWQSDSKITYNETDYYIPNSMAGARAWFDDGHYVVSARAIVAEDGGSLEFGFRGNTTGDSKWIIFSDFELKYIDTDVLIAVTEAERVIGVANGIKDSKMNADVQTALTDAIDALQSNVTTAESTGSAYVAGANYNTLVTAISNANASIAIYEAITASYDEYATLAEANMTTAGQTAFSSSSAVTDYTNGAYTDSETAIAAIAAAYISALKANPENGTDMTAVITNPSFETGDLTGWTGSDFSILNGSDLSTKDGTYYAYLNNNRTRSLTQTIEDLAVGKYILSINARLTKSGDNAGTATLGLGDNTTSIPIDRNAATYTVAYETNEVADIAVSYNKAPTYTYHYFDNFTLTYYTTLPDVDVTALAAKTMKPSVQTALNASSSAYAASKTAVNYNALQAAKTNAEISADAYAAYAVYEAKAVANLTAEGLASFNSDATVAPYYEGTYEGTDAQEAAIKAAYMSALANYRKVGADVTDYITNPSFETDAAIADLTSGQTSPTGWTLTTTGTENAQWGTANASTTISGIATTFNPYAGDNYYYIRSNWNAGTDYTLSQTVNNIPAGYYRLSCRMATYASAETTTYSLSAQEESETEVSSSTTTAVGEWTEWALTVEKKSASTSLTITANMVPGAADGGRHFQMLLDNFQLTYLGSVDFSISEDETAAPVEQLMANVTLTRTLKGGQWNGFSVPFGFTVAGSALDGASVKQFSSASDNEITLEDATEIVAGKPYLVKPAEDDIENPTFSGVAVSNPDEVTCGDGAYTFQAHLYATDLATDGSVAYVSTTDSSIKKLTSGSIKGLRAVFNIPTGGEVKALVVRFDGMTTGLLTIDADGNMHDGAFYNLAGQRMTRAPKGIYIVGGKKVAFK